MESLRLPFAACMASAAIIFLAWSPAGQSQPMPRKHHGLDSGFRLHAVYSEFSAEIVLPEGFKMPPRIDGRLTEQVGEVRTAFPNWHGIHVLTPGLSRSGR